MRVILIVIGVGWAVFWLYWLSAAVGSKRSIRVWTGRSIVIRLVIVIVVVLLVRAPGIGQHTGFVSSPYLHGAGLALWAMGLCVAVWARVYLGTNWGMPMTQRIHPELITSGPYRYVRHPIYSGILLGIVGTALASNLYGLIVAALAGGYFMYSATVEERNMTSRFPENYPEYRRSTKMLIPFVI